VPDCIFCAIVDGSAPSERIYEDEHAVAFLDIAQATEGHTLLVPRSHCVDLTDIGPDRAADLMRAAVNVAAILRTALEPAGMNVVHASGGTAWQTVFHFHMHLIPRYRYDELNLPWIPSPKPVEALRPLADRIRASTG
jgi:histidine triad (HIT) family protein